MSAEHKRKLRREQTRRYRAKKKKQGFVLKYVPSWVGPPTEWSPTISRIKMKKLKWRRKK